MKRIILVKSFCPENVAIEAMVKEKLNIRSCSENGADYEIIHILNSTHNRHINYIFNKHSLAIMVPNLNDIGHLIWSKQPRRNFPCS